MSVSDEIVFDEIWDFDGTDVYVVADPIQEGARKHNIARLSEIENGSPESMDARGHLARTAPEMYRMLLAREWVDSSFGEYAAICSSCKNNEPYGYMDYRQSVAGRTDALGWCDLGRDVQAAWEARAKARDGHAKDCAWKALMRKARGE